MPRQPSCKSSRCLEQQQHRRCPCYHLRAHMNDFLKPSFAIVPTWQECEEVLHSLERKEAQAAGCTESSPKVEK